MPLIGGRGEEVVECHDPDHHESVVVAALCRRFGWAATGPLTIDLSSGALSVDGRAVPLTRTEAAVLAHLARHLGVICSHEEITTAVWDSATAELWGKGSGWRRWNALRTPLTRLRGKLGAGGHLLENRPDLGYRLVYMPPTPSAAESGGSS